MTPLLMIRSTYLSSVNYMDIKFDVLHIPNVAACCAYLHYNQSQSSVCSPVFEERSYECLLLH